MSSLFKFMLWKLDWCDVISSLRHALIQYLGCYSRGSSCQSSCSHKYAVRWGTRPRSERQTSTEKRKYAKKDLHVRVWFHSFLKAFSFRWISWICFTFQRLQFSKWWQLIYHGDRSFFFFLRNGVTMQNQTEFQSSSSHTHMDTQILKDHESLKWIQAGWRCTAAMFKRNMLQVPQANWDKAF